MTRILRTPGSGGGGSAGSSGAGAAIDDKMTAMASAWSEQRAGTFLHVAGAPNSEHGYLNQAVDRRAHASVTNQGSWLMREGIGSADMTLISEVLLPPAPAGGGAYSASDTNADVNFAIAGRVTTDPNANSILGLFKSTGSGASGLQLYAFEATVVTALTGLVAGPAIVPSTTRIWQVLRLVQDTAVYEIWTTDPKAGGTAPYRQIVTLTSSRIASLRAGGAQKVGFRTHSFSGLQLHRFSAEVPVLS